MVSVRQMANNPVSGLALLILTFLIAWFFRDVILVILVAMLLTMSLLPVVDRLEKHGVRRWLAAITPLTVSVLAIAGLVSLILPKLIQQTDGLLTSVPQLAQQLSHRYHLNLGSGTTDLSGSSQALLNATFSVVGFIGFVAVVVFFSLYWLIDYHGIKKALINFLATEHRAHVRELSNKAERRVVAWVRGQIILSLVVGVISAVAYSLIGLPFAIIFGVLAGLLEIIPFLGPILAAIPAFILALSISPSLAVAVFVIYLVVQAVESNILAPKIMSEAVNLHPLSVILSFLIGARIAGFVGILLAVPVVLIMTAAYNVYSDALARE